MHNAAGTEPLHADHALAVRLEALVAEDMRRFVAAARVLDPKAEAECLEMAGGVAVYVTSGSPVNQACALGLSGPVFPGDVERLERFFRVRGARPVITVCPLAHPTLLESLAMRGWTADGFEHVLVRRIAPDERFEPAPEGVTIRTAETAAERDAWAWVAATGFSSPLDPLPEQVTLGLIASRREGSRLFVGYLGDTPAGTGELYVSDGVAWLSADATLEHFRGRGIQAALQRHRLAEGVAAGCELAVTECAPGSGSQRNMERLGFRIAYTRIELVAPEGAPV